MEIPLKIKMFIWKTCYNWIPTRGNPSKRGVNCNDICQICGKNNESTLHALWDCSKLKYVRVWWLPSGKFCDTHFGSILELLDFYSKRLTKVEMELFCINLWKVWCCRNDWMHKGNSFDVNEVVWWSKNFAEEIHIIGSSRGKGIVTEGRRREEVDDR
ncbi:hypothetical protein Ddye_000482 [Dipteronia dyeriana]|uniref:Reverse transcriptase zinc-binding domain-containing protein n=1 Tax=Dipteronia dyeriana TaxID=168575 RepID=A0AAD9XMD0_9ROSI|nr:hypothetical protein Ddye_000482 [Dipteronia dyeriana]